MKLRIGKRVYVRGRGWGRVLGPARCAGAALVKWKRSGLASVVRVGRLIYK
jgi:hypothetical protein